MTDEYVVEVTETAKTDMREILDYFIDRGIEKGRLDYLERYYNAVIRLSHNPYSLPRLISRLTPKLMSNNEVRYLTSGKYIFFYKIKGETVFLTRIVDGRTNWMKLF